MNIKLIIAAVLFIALCASVVCTLRMYMRHQNKRKNTQAGSIEFLDDVETEASIPSTQSLLPIADINGPCLIQTDGTAISYIKLDGENMTLKDSAEQILAAEHIAAALSTSQALPLKILHIHRPVDSTKYIVALYERRESVVAQLKACVAAPHPNKHLITGLSNRICMIDDMISRNETDTVERSRNRTDAYIVLPVPYQASAEELAYKRAQDMHEALRAQGITSHILFDQDITRMLLDYERDYRTVNQTLTPSFTTPILSYISEKEALDEY